MPKQQIINMSAVIRVKRRIDEEPLDAFILNCKKRRVDDTDDGAAGSSSTKSTSKSNLLENPNEKSTVLKFAGTIQDQVFHPLSANKI